MYRVILTSVVILVLLGCGCARKPRTVEKYAKDGISFNHYSTWRITKDEPMEDDPDSRSITVEGPNEAIVMLICIPPNELATVEAFAEGVASGRLEQMDNLKIGSIKPAEIVNTSSEPITGKVGGRVSNGILQRFSIKILGQLVPHEARIFLVENDQMKVFVMAQVATEELRDTTPAFDLILDSISLADRI